MADTRATTVGGSAVLGALITGVGALLFAYKSISAGQFEAAAIAMVAAAIAFVGVAHTVFRH
ncbi:MAG TPA: hypothetical protein VFV49_08670 [Thermoanaerobaculia bacterium]|nr:hypothetical protein [Thermoanaerobaculia bacterium]